MVFKIDRLKQRIDQNTAVPNFGRVKGQAISTFVVKDPVVASVVSKLNADTTTISNQQRRQDKDTVFDENRLNFAGFMTQYQKNAERMKGNDNIYQLFPDMELSVQTLCSLVLSPKDMMGVSYVVNTKNISNKYSADVLSKIIQVITKELEKTYDIKEDLPEIVKSTLFTKGATLKVVLPENNLDYLINRDLYVATEDLEPHIVTKTNKFKNLGFLGQRATTSTTNKVVTEELRTGRNVSKFEDDIMIEGTHNSFVSITDNFNILKLPKLKSINQKITTEALIRGGVAVESLFETNKKNKITVSDIYKVNTSTNNTPIDTVDPTKSIRPSVGRPIVMNIPVEAVIPIHVPGNPKDYLGFIILLDETGVPLTTSSYVKDVHEFKASSTTDQGVTNFLLEKARTNLQTNDKGNEENKELTALYSSYIEKEIIDRLNNGNFTRSFALSKRDDIYRTMMYRSLAGRRTRMLFIPSEIATYFTHEVYDNGVGKSLFEKIKVLLSLRGILLFAKMSALTKNSISVTNVNMTLDPNDPDPMNTIEKAMHEVIRTRQQYLPIGISSPLDLAEWVQRAGLEFTFEGHPGLPNTKLQFDAKKMGFEVPDAELEETLQDQCIMALGLSPETIKMGTSPEFATTVVQNNILLSKRLMTIQGSFEKSLASYIKAICKYDHYLTAEVKKILDDSKAELLKAQEAEDKSNNAENKQTDEVRLQQIYNDIMTNLEFEFIKPDSVSIANQKESYDAYKEAVKEALDDWLGDDLFNGDLSGELSGKVAAIKASILGLLLRKYSTEKGFLTELSALLPNTDDNAVNIYEELHNYNTTIAKELLEFLKMAQGLKLVVNTDVSKISEIAAPSETMDE